MAQAEYVPALIAFTRPFRFVLRDENDRWAPTTKEVANREYDYVKLHRLTMSIDIGLPTPFCLHMGYDGSLLLPPLPEFTPPEKALSVFNRTLGQMLLGGIYCQAVEPADIDTGIIYSTGYFRSMGKAKSLIGRLHNYLKIKAASPLDQIDLLYAETVTAWDVHQAIITGRTISQRIKNLSVMLVLQGVTSFVSHNWSEALINFWIAIEQAISLLWEEQIVRGGKVPSEEIGGRTAFLRSSTVWTTSTRIEVLFQSTILDDETYSLLFKIRKARNNFVHEGTLPDVTDAGAAFDALFRIISIMYAGTPETFTGLVEKYKSIDPLTHRFVPLGTEPIPVDQLKGHWFGPLPSIPGDAEWGDKEYEQVPLVKDE